MNRILLLTVLLLLRIAGPASAQRLEVLFLGDNGHHAPAERFSELMRGLGPYGVNLTYTDRMADLNPATLASYDVLAIYANTETIAPAEEKAMLDFVRGGRGLVALHCASYCFRNSIQYVAMVGGQFESHGTGTFTTNIDDPAHPVMAGFAGFETWDETYVHTRGAPDRHILQLRDGEPYTWTRSEGSGRVFYTAYGHDSRTFLNPGFIDLVYRGTRWAAGDARAAAFDAWKPAPLEYRDEPGVPNYERRDPPPKFQLGLSADESQKHMQIPAGYEMSVIATEPAIGNVIDMKWDERGRLWVVETKDYPNTVTDHADGSDRIAVLEDTNGDGRMDTHVVFADRINIPTSLCFANGGIVVTAAPDTFYLKDTDGDGRADERRVLFTGWGKSDTHAGPASLHFGFDGWIYGTVGYSGFRGVVGGESQRFGQGVFRFMPDGSRLEFLGPTTNNTWGLGIGENGDIFGSTANNQSSFYLPIPWTLARNIEGFEIGGRLPGIDENKRMWTIMDKLRQVDVFGGFTAASGHEIYTARSYPPDCWNRMALVSEPTGHVVYRAFLEQEGTHFHAQNGWNLLAAADEWVAPVVAQTGPDGAVWVSDWYSFLVQHNPTPSARNGGFDAVNGRGNAFVSSLRDTEKCRIYRIVWKDGMPSRQFRLSVDNRDGLLEALQSDNLGWRLHAQRLLVEGRHADAVPRLLELVADRSVDAAGVNGPAINALWTLYGLGATADPEVRKAVTAALTHPAQGVRRAAMSVLPRDAAAVDAILPALRDPEPLVRLTALRELCSLPASEAAGRALFAMSDDAAGLRDRWLPIARTLAAVRHGAGFLTAAIAAAPTGESDATAEPNPEPEPVNLFEAAAGGETEGNRSRGWRVRTYSGEATHSANADGRNGGQCYRIESEKGADTSYHFDLDLETGHDYLLSGWIRTENLRTRRGGRGAMLELHELNGDQPHTDPLTGTNDWTRVELKFSTRGQRRVSVNLLYGGWGHATGRAWWDDLSLVDLGVSQGGGYEAGAEADPVPVVARNLAAFAGAPAVAQVRDAAAARPSDVSAAIVDALTNAPAAAAAVTQSPEQLAATHQMLTVRSTVGTMQYDVAEFEVAAGKPVAIVYENPDALQHNLVVAAPGTYESTGVAADRMITDPEGFAKSFIPESPDILAGCPMLDPGQSATIVFTPDKPGDYPFLCTFPGHWRIMKGVIRAR